MKALLFYTKTKITYASGHKETVQSLFENSPTNKQIIDSINSNYDLYGSSKDTIVSITVEAGECEDCYIYEDYV